MNFSEKKRDGFLAPSLNKKEQIAASALLLFLSLHQPSPPPSLSSSFGSSSSFLTTSRNREVEEEISISYSYSCCSQETSSCSTDSCSSSTLTAEVDQIHGQPPLRLLELAAAAATSHASFLSPKVVKKARSKIHRKRKILSRMRVVYDLLNSQGNKDQDDADLVVLALSTAATDAADANTTASVPGPSSSSVASAVTSVKRNSSLKVGSTKKNQDKSSSSSSKTASTPSSCARASSSHKASRSINRRALAIVNWLAGVGCASEVNIRAAVGDSPDTSKALRLLVKRAEVNRTGAGGRTDPFLYAVTSKGTMQ